MLGCPGREEVKPPHHHRVECLGRHMCIRGSRTVFLWSYCPFFPCSNRRQTREARLGHGSNCLVLTRRLDHWYGNTHTHTQRERQIKRCQDSLDWSILNDCLRAGASYSDSTGIHFAFTVAVCWQETLLLL